MSYIIDIIVWLLVFNLGFAIGWCLRVLWCEMGVAVNARWDGTNE